MTQLSSKVLDFLLTSQKNEITEYYIYQNIAKRTKDEHNKKVLYKIAKEEKAHYDYFKKFTKRDVSPSKFKIKYYTIICLLFGLTFGVKLMEKGENGANAAYLNAAKEFPEIIKIADDEDRHEQELISIISEERLEYMGSIVLGLNDALVELTGALAGFTLSLQNSRIIAFMGLITGISASFSMAASEYLSTKADGGDNAIKSAIYTGIAYVVTVILLILPFFLISNYIISLIVTVLIAVFVILIFNYYISIAKDYPFKKRFFEMALISLGVAAISFGIGFIIKQFFGFEI